jgi:hypothetical protein
MLPILHSRENNPPKLRLVLVTTRDTRNFAPFPSNLDPTHLLASLN